MIFEPTWTERQCANPTCSRLYYCQLGYEIYQRYTYCSTVCFKACLTPSRPVEDFVLGVPVGREGDGDGHAGFFAPVAATYPFLVAAPATLLICSECGARAAHDELWGWHCARHLKAKIYRFINGRYAGEEPPL